MTRPFASYATMTPMFDILERRLLDHLDGMAGVFADALDEDRLAEAADIVSEAMTAVPRYSMLADESTETFATRAFSQASIARGLDFDRLYGRIVIDAWYTTIPEWSRAAVFVVCQVVFEQWHRGTVARPNSIASYAADVSSVLRVMLPAVLARVPRE